PHLNPRRLRRTARIESPRAVFLVARRRAVRVIRRPPLPRCVIPTEAHVGRTAAGHLIRQVRLGLAEGLAAIVGEADADRRPTRRPFNRRIPPREALAPKIPRLRRPPLDRPILHDRLPALPAVDG